MFKNADMSYWNLFLSAGKHSDEEEKKELVDEDDRQIQVLLHPEQTVDSSFYMNLSSFRLAKLGQWLGNQAGNLSSNVCPELSGRRPIGGAGAPPSLRRGENKSNVSNV